MISKYEDVIGKPTRIESKRFCTTAHSAKKKGPPPVIPPAPVSRTHSSQGTHRPARASVTQDSSSASNRSNPFAASEGQPTAALADNSRKESGNGIENRSGNKSKKYRKHAKKSNFQAFLDFLTKLVLLALTIYVFSVCPQDTRSQSPICRGLAEYKRIVLDPYVIPPLQAALAHPSIAPHIERAKPYVDRAVEFTTPILLRTQREWNLHVVPQWERRIVPEWNRRVVPHWNKHVAPRTELLRAKEELYRLRAIQEYEQRIVPHARVAMYNLQHWQRQAQPYILLAVSKTRDGYDAAKPYAIPLAKRLGHAPQQFALSLQEQRQKFLDPHVAKIWEKVKELSGGKQVVHEAMPGHEPPSPNPVFTIVETVGYEITLSSTPSAAPVYQTASEDPKHSHEEILSTLSDDATAAAEVDEPIPIPKEPPVTSSAEPTRTESLAVPTDVETLLSTGFDVAESLHQPELSSSSAAAFTEELNASIADEPVVTSTPVQIPGATPSVLANTASASSSAVSSAAEEPKAPTASVTRSKFPVSSASSTAARAHSSSDDEIDIDAFYAELGLNEPLENSSGFQEHSSIPPSPPAETEEEKAKRLRLKTEETARKRADIGARHAKWEAELQTQMEHSTAQLQSRLRSLREEGAADLASSVDVRNSIEELVTEAEKYIKGVEIYLKNLKGENRKSDEKLALWDRVVEKVGKKFTEHLLATEGVVNARHSVVRDKELQVVSTATAAVRDVAEKGQLDLGLDYAWLDDVTYNDWQRYHALIGTSEKYAHEATAIQNGTYPDALASNPLIPILEDLKSEIQDVVIGFETRLRRIKRDGERAFNNNNSNGSTQKGEDKGSAVEPEEPEVSILPVQPEGTRGDPQGFIPPVVIGRSQQEILEALGKVEPVDQAKTTSGDSSIDPEKAVSNLIQEVEEGAERPSANADILHAEL
ncbi:hypothetical protein BS17DRAFT_810959 [Gyrodon lividus]|nr:hypothetical protein BS17DRAFT_810959 [Gyrodon lividus]